MAASFAELTIQVNAIVDALAKEKAKNLLEIYIAAWNAMATGTANTVVSYSIAGRTVQRKNDDDFRNYVATLEQDIMVLIYGRTSYVSDSGGPLR